MGKGLKRNDWILLGVLLIAAAVLYVIISYKSNSKGMYAEIEADGQIVTVLNLREDTTYRIGDDEYNILVISDGVAYVAEATCKNQLCVKQGEISKKGENIICLPHKTIIKIVGE